MKSIDQLMSRTRCHGQSAHLVNYDPTSGLVRLDFEQLYTMQITLLQSRYLNKQY